MAKHDPNARILDKRLFERSISRGKISQADFDAHLAALPDQEANAENIAPLLFGSEDAEDSSAS